MHGERVEHDSQRLSPHLTPYCPHKRRRARLRYAAVPAARIPVRHLRVFWLVRERSAGQGWCYNALCLPLASGRALAPESQEVKRGA
jgi:hypothetical protein